MSQATTPTDHKRVVHGPAVRAIREALGFKHGDFAIRCDISPSYLTNIEKGIKQPAPDVAVRFATQLGVPLAAITYSLPSGVKAA
jgi:transcriptional regulator with XRE-family HTH domain